MHPSNNPSIYAYKHKHIRSYVHVFAHACMRLYKRKNHADTLHKPAQPVVPLFVHPDGQLPQVRPPGVLLHARLVSHPPFPLLHSSMSKHAFPKTFMHTLMHTCKTAHPRIHATIRPCMHTNTSMHVQTCMRAHSYIHIYMHACIQTYKTRTHTRQTCAACGSIIRPP